MSLRYYLLADCLKHQKKETESRNILRKLIYIWTTTLLKKVNGVLDINIEELYVTESIDILTNALATIENDLGAVHTLVGECEMALGLLWMIGDGTSEAIDHLQTAVDVLNNTAGQFDSRTEEALRLLKVLLIFICSFWKVVKNSKKRIVELLTNSYIWMKWVLY